MFAGSDLVGLFLSLKGLSLLEFGDFSKAFSSDSKETAAVFPGECIFSD
jgi:hypothetical protein